MKKKSILAGSICIITAFSLISIYSYSKAPYNKEPNVASKIVGSKDLMASKLPTESIDDLSKSADLIVIGKVISDPVDTEIDFPFPNEEMKQKALKGSNEVPKVNLACSKIQIEEIIYGESKSDIITLAQIGKANSNSGQTKVKNGDRMYFILKRSPDDINKYASARFEEGLFIIDKNDKTISMSDNKFTSRYDGISKDILKRDLIKGKKKE